MSDALATWLGRLDLDALTADRLALGGGEAIFDQLRALALIHEERQRIRDLLIALAGGPRAPDVDPPADAAAPADDGLGDEGRALLELLERARGFVLRSPIASQAVFSALVAEGRRYSQTERGAAWAERLARSSAIRRGRELWEATSLNLLVADEETVLPSTWVEALLRAVDLPEIEQILARLHGGAR